MMGLIGKKQGMTKIFEAGGNVIPVTVIGVMPNVVTQIKQKELDGYLAVQVTTGESSEVNKPLEGHYKRAGVVPGKGLWEFVCKNLPKDVVLGTAFNVDLFSEGQMVDVIANSKGKGFAGVIKRHNFSSQPATHGNSLSHRAPGSIGQRQTPGRVFKGKKMAGHMGNERVTIQNQKIVKIDKERGLLFLRGAIPGAKGGDVIIKPAVKTKREGE